MDPGRRLLFTRARVLSGLRGGAALATSTGVHLLLLAALVTTGVLSLGRQARLPVSLVPLTPDAWAVNRFARGEAPHPVEPAPRFIELPPDVDRDPLRKEVPPPRARHLAARSQSVDDERVSRDAGVLEDLLRVAQRAFEGAEGSGQRGREPFAAPGREGPRGAGGIPDAPLRSTSPLAETPDETAPAAEDEPPSAPSTETLAPLAGAEGGERIVGERIAGLPTRELPRPEGSPNWDGRAEVPEGDETRLDAREVGSAPFWIDVRHRIELEWQRRAVATFRRLDPREDVFFWKERTAVLKVALGAAGELRKVEVVESSKLGFFDDIALEAVRASRYPPPPPEALGDKREASIRVRITWLPSVRAFRTR